MVFEETSLEDNLAELIKIQWFLPQRYRNLSGKAVDSFKQLEGLMPGYDEGLYNRYSKVFLGGEQKVKNFMTGKDSMYREYSVNFEFTLNNKLNNRHKVAYQCPHCDKIIIGAPRIEPYKGIDSRSPLSGSNGVNILCRSCGGLIHQLETLIS